MIEVDARLAELEDRYRASLPIKRASLELAWRLLRIDPVDPARFQNLQRIVHRLAGSAPSYGYVEIGELACSLDARLEHLRESDDHAVRSVAMTAGLGDVEPLIARLMDALGGARH